MSQVEQTDRELFDCIAHFYVKKDLCAYSRVARKLRLLTTLKNMRLPIKSILEIGCGAGFSAQYLNGKFERFVGLDYSEKLIEYAEKHNSSMHTQFVCKNINEFKTEEKFDVILMIGVLHHIPDAGHVIENLKKYLKDNGVIIVNEPQSGNPLVGWLRRIRKMIDSKYSSAQIEFSIEQIEELFCSHGYSVTSFPQGIFSTPFAESLIFPNYIGIPMISVFQFLDPVVEALISRSRMRRLAWNVVIEACPKS